MEVHENDELGQPQEPLLPWEGKYAIPPCERSSDLHERVVDALARGQRLAISIARAREAASGSTGGLATLPAPKQYLTSWREIIAALERQYSKPETLFVRRLNDKFDGPIQIGRRGEQPFVDRAMLIGWWNELEARSAEVDQRRKDQLASVATTHPYGRSAQVAPEIAGSIKERRHTRSRKITKDRKR